MGYLPLTFFLENDIRSSNDQTVPRNFYKDARKVQNINSIDNQYYVDLSISSQAGIYAEDADTSAESYLITKNIMDRAVLYNDGQDDVRIKYNGNYFVFEGGKYYLMDKQEVSFFISKAIENNYSLMTASFEDWKNNNGESNYYYW